MLTDFDSQYPTLQFPLVIFTLHVNVCSVNGSSSSKSKNPSYFFHGFPSPHDLPQCFSSSPSSQSGTPSHHAAFPMHLFGRPLHAVSSLRHVGAEPHSRSSEPSWQSGTPSQMAVASYMFASLVLQSHISSSVPSSQSTVPSHRWSSNTTCVILWQREATILAILSNSLLSTRPNPGRGERK